MSRSGYVYDYDDVLSLGRWRGQVASAIRGKRGQLLLKDLIAALNELSQKALISNELESSEGDVCALGAVGKLRNLDMSWINPNDPLEIAYTFDIAEPLAKEIMFENDEAGEYDETPEQRYIRMRRWAESVFKA